MYHKSMLKESAEEVESIVRSRYRWGIHGEATDRILTVVDLLIVWETKTNFWCHISDGTCESSKLIETVNRFVTVPKLLSQTEVKQLNISLCVEPNVVRFLRRKRTG